MTYRGTTQVWYRRDAQGNVIALVENGAVVARYAYDAWGNIAKVFENGVLTTRYEYDINGYRVRKYTPNGTHKYYRNGEQFLTKEITVGNSVEKGLLSFGTADTFSFNPGDKSIDEWIKEFLTELFGG